MGTIGDLGVAADEVEELTFGWFADCTARHRCREDNCPKWKTDEDGNRIPHDHACRGREMRVNPEATDLHFGQFLDRAADVKVQESLSMPDATRATFDYIRQQVHEEDWPDFWRVAVWHNRTSVHLLDVAKAIIEAVTGFPTAQPSDSSGGQRATNGSSPDDSRSTRREVDRRARKSQAKRVKATRVAMRQLHGRGDLQLGLLQSAARAGALPPEWTPYASAISALSST